MTERFTETISTGIVMDTVTGKEYNCEMRIDDDFLNLVNTIAEENERLQTQLSQLAKVNREGVKKVQSLAKENEELRTKNNAHLQDIEVYREDNTHLKLENEQLKSYTGEMEDYLARLEEKNEELKKEVKQLKNKIKTYNSANELLKETIDRLRSDG